MTALRGFFSNTLDINSEIVDIIKKSNFQQWQEYVKQGLAWGLSLLIRLPIYSEDVHVHIRFVLTLFITFIYSYVDGLKYKWCFIFQSKVDVNVLSCWKIF